MLPVDRARVCQGFPQVRLCAVAEKWLPSASLACNPYGIHECSLRKRVWSTVKDGCCFASRGGRSEARTRRGTTGARRNQSRLYEVGSLTFVFVLANNSYPVITSNSPSAHPGVHTSRAVVGCHTSGREHVTHCTISVLSPRDDVNQRRIYHTVQLFYQANPLLPCGVWSSCVATCRD